CDAAEMARHLEAEPDPRRIAREARLDEVDVVLAAKMPAAPLARQVDRLDETREPRDELVTRTRVDLPIFLDIEGVGARSRQKFVAPVPRDARLDAVLVIIGDGVGAVAEAGQRELRLRRR